MTEPLMDAVRLSRSFGGGLFARGEPFRAVDSVDLAIHPGEAVGLVGESGSGKSTLGRMLLGLLPPSAGSVRFAGATISGMTRARLRPLRRHMQMVFQDPFGSLDPRRRIGRQIEDGLRIHRPELAVSDRGERVAGLLSKVGLDPSYGSRYPHELSGGQRQRVAIARALAPGPIFVVADEPVSALDVSVQAQILELLAELQRDLNLTLLFISHDLHVVRHVCRRVLVMYQGKIVEEGTTAEVFDDPKHPYTRTLMNATPSLTRKMIW